MWSLHYCRRMATTNMDARQAFMSTSGANSRRHSFFSHVAHVARTPLISSHTVHGTVRTFSAFTWRASSAPPGLLGKLRPGASSSRCCCHHDIAGRTVGQSSCAPGDKIFCWCTAGAPPLTMQITKTYATGVVRPSCARAKAARSRDVSATPKPWKPRPTQLQYSQCLVPLYG